MTDYTLRTIPFRILRPAALSLSAVCQMVLSQVYTKAWEHQAFAMKVMVLTQQTGDMRGHTRARTIAITTSWYGAAKELAALVEPTHPQFAKMLSDMVAQASWLEPAWEYMRGQIDEQASAPIS